MNAKQRRAKARKARRYIGQERARMLKAYIAQPARDGRDTPRNTLHIKLRSVECLA